MIIGHQVTGTNKTLLIDIKLQLMGLNAAIVAITSTPVDPDMEPEPLPKPHEESALPVFLAKEDGLKFRMPGKPLRTIDDAANSVTWQLLDESHPAVYSVQVFTFQEDFEPASKEFFRIMNGTLAEGLGGKIVNEEDASLGGHPGQLLMIETEESGVVMHRDIIVGKKVYSLQWQAKERDSDLEAKYAVPFITSLELIGKSPPAEIPEPAPPAAATDDDAPVPRKR